MLRQLAIRDVVLVERLELEFEPGLGVLTGETGAGKSILLDALGLGARRAALGIVELLPPDDRIGLAAPLLAALLLVALVAFLGVLTTLAAFLGILAFRLSAVAGAAV